MASCSSYAVWSHRFSSCSPSLVRSSVPALRISCIGLSSSDGGKVGPGSCGGEFGGEPAKVPDPPPRRCRNCIPVPGMEAVPYTPRGPTFRVRGAPPKLRLKPVFPRLSFSPGISLNDCRNRQLIPLLLLVSSCLERRRFGYKPKDVIENRIIEEYPRMILTAARASDK